MLRYSDVTTELPISEGLTFAITSSIHNLTSEHAFFITLFFYVLKWRSTQRVSIVPVC